MAIIMTAWGELNTASLQVSDLNLSAYSDSDLNRIKAVLERELADLETQIKWYGDPDSSPGFRREWLVRAEIAKSRRQQNLDMIVAEVNGRESVKAGNLAGFYREFHRVCTHYLDKEEYANIREITEQVLQGQKLPIEEGAW